MTPDLPIRRTLSGATMGTRYSATFYASAETDLATLAQELQVTVDRVDAQMSNWKPDSDLSRFNRALAGEWVAIPEELAFVVETAIAVGHLSGGAFDIGVGDAVNAWGFGPAGSQPSGEAIARAGRNGVRRFAQLDLDRKGLRLRKSSPLSLDLCGIAKGYGVDELARCLERAGIRSYLVGIDGEMRAADTKPDGTAWAIAIERPDRDRRAAAGVIALTDCSIATSGDYRHVVRWDDVDLSHTIDPRTGRPVRNGLASVTVLAPDCMPADAFATMLMVLGEEAGPVLAAQLRIDALFFIREGEALREIGTGMFAADDSGIGAPAEA